MSSVIREPAVNATLKGSDSPVPNEAQKVLIIGQCLDADQGGLTDGQFFENYLGDENADFGRRSQLAGLIREFKTANAKSGNPWDHVNQFDVIVLFDGAGTPAVYTFGFTGTSTAAGTLRYSGGSKDDDTYELAVPDATSASFMVIALAAQMDTDNLDLPYLHTAVSTDVIATCQNDGEDMRIGYWFDTSDVPGITATGGAWTGGTVNPDLTGIFDVLGDRRYQTIISPYYNFSTPGTVSDITDVSDVWDAKFNADGEILDGVVIVSAIHTQADHTTKVALLNSQSLDYVALPVSEGNTEGDWMTPMEIPYEMSARLGGIRARRLTQDHNIADLVIASAPLDQFGGPAIASLPYHNTPIQASIAFEGALPPTTGVNGWSKTQMDALQTAGCSFIGQNRPGNATIVGPQVTTYKTTPAGNADGTWKYLNYVDTASNVREYMSNNVRARYAQSRLTEGKVMRGREQENAESISAYLDGLYADLASPDFVLTQGGEDALNHFKANKFVTLDLITGTVTAVMDVPIVTQIRNVNMPITISFTIEQG